MDDLDRAADTPIDGERDELVELANDAGGHYTALIADLGRVEAELAHRQGAAGG